MTTAAGMRPIQFGSTTVQQVVELERWVFPPEALFPAITPDLIDEARQTLDGRSVDPETGDFHLSVHTYLVRTRSRVILVDSCNGNDKPRPAFQSVDRLATPYLERLADAGVRPEDVDLVMCTHLHPDHVGWNTRLVDGTWVPTFPNAKYLVGQLEFDDMKEWYETGPRSHPLDHDLASSFVDSVLPVIASGQAVFVGQGHVVERELDHGVWLESTPGHTRGHAAVHVQGGGRHAVATGDAFHHLVQINHPELPQGADVDPVQSTATRRRLFEEFADTDTIVLPGHFPAPTAGRVVGRGGRLAFEFLDE
jgi:glyoxylase-like metal-dependent hydrolase (beta-lactamase superfamily II)